jgi:hypothetical protein
VEAGKEIKLDAQHFEVGNQTIRFDDSTEIPWRLRSTRGGRPDDVKGIKESGDQAEVSPDRSWEPAAHDVLDRARRRGIRVTEEERPSRFGWK